MDSLAADKAELAALLNHVHTELRDEALAFPESLRLVHPAPGEWCAMELLGHVAEMHYSYVKRAEQLIASPGAPLARDMASPERMAAIAGGPALTLEEALNQLDEARLHALAFLDRLKPNEMVITGHHQALGPMTVRDVFARTIVGHAQNHLQQLRATREQIEAAASADG
ncbi:MAG TPA: DinB family protein [Chloroflexota bacterium]|nr:DinB family protein [Chloroflexota bacterium]